MSKPIKGSKEWFAAKKQARADLDLRLSLGLPHSNKPIDGTVAKVTQTPEEKTAEATAKKAAKAAEAAAKKAAKGGKK